MRKKVYQSLIFILLTVAIKTETSDESNQGDSSGLTENNSSVHEGPATESVHTTENYQVLKADCPDNVECVKLSGDCLNCTLDYSCVYGREYEATCRARPSVVCIGDPVFRKKYKCQYCYQTERWQQTCTNSTDCKVVTAPREKYIANCSVDDDIICLGRRHFHRNLPCNWTSGKRWSTALILSITLGGFGADRFYLGHWRAGIGKLFSFGGLGVWTIVDVILVASGYVGPADYSLYIF